MSSPTPLPNADGRRFWCHQCRAEIRPSSDFACLGCGNDFIEELEESGDDDPTAFVAFGGQPPTAAAPLAQAPPIPHPLFPFAAAAQPAAPFHFQTMFGGAPGGVAPPPYHHLQHPQNGGQLPMPAPIDFGQLVQQVDAMMHQMAAPQQQQPGAPPVMQVFSTGGGGGGGGGMPPMNFQAFMQSMLSGLNGGQMVGNPGDYAFGSLDNIITRLMETAGDRGPPPAAKDAVESLPSVRISQDAVDAHEDCAICKDEYTVGEEALKLSCDHRFHPTCIKEWLGMRNTCPVCRFELKAAEKPSARGNTNGEGNNNRRGGGGGGRGGNNSNENNAADSPFQFYL